MLSVYPTMCQGSGARITDLKTLKNGPNDDRIMFYREPKQGSSSGQWTHHSRLLIISSGCGATADLLPILGAGE